MRPLLKTMVIASIFAMLFGLLLPARVISLGVIKAFANFVASVVPCVSVIANGASNPSRAEITWAVQWLFAPVYFIVLMNTANPWRKEMRRAIVKTCRERKNSRCNPFGIAFVIACLGVMILSDFGVVNFGSFYQGDMFRGNPSQLPILLRAPFESNMAMTIYGWVIPLAVALYYELFLLLTVNFKLYLNKQDS